MTAMKWGIMVCLALGAGGCFGAELTPEQEGRIEELRKKNDETINQMADIYAKLQSGALTLKEAQAALASLRKASEENIAEMRKVYSEGGKGGTILAAIALFGRTALHAASKLPLHSVPGGAILQGLLTFLLGGSETKKKKPESVPA